MGGSTEIVKHFATPDRAPPQSSAVPEEEKKDVSLKEAMTDTKATKPKAAIVTPPESMQKEEAAQKRDAESSLQMVASQVESPEDKHVRFDKAMEKVDAVDSPSSTNTQRGLVSRRGGRYSSPARVAKNPSSPKESVLEFKTYRSPPRKREESDTVPSLCSINSIDKQERITKKASKEAKIKKKDVEKESSSSDDKKPASISCDAAINQTSPLTADTPDGKVAAVKSEDNRSEPVPARKNNVSFSPVPPARDSERPLKTPTKSPTGGQFQTLPTLDDALRSPVGIFLSPHPPTPSYRRLEQSDSFDKSDRDERRERNGDKPGDSKPPARSPKTPRSPRTPRREPDRDRLLATPTDFAMDYGKHPTSNSFDSSNVLAWLQSPTANGLFSPGGFGSILNTPRGGLGPRTPRTPTVSTSFFFSDVAGLPRSGDYASPKPGGDGGKRGSSNRGYSNIICISPLASSKAKNGSNNQSNTPTINYKEMFASPAEKSRGLSLLGDSPLKGAKSRGRSASRDPSLDAVHLAERDLMEDEDLSVLLQLASNTPKPGVDRPVAVSTSDGTHVFRSPSGRVDGRGDGKLPSLQLPIIGGRESEGNSTRLSRKTHSRDHGDAKDGYPRQLGMRSNGSKEYEKSKSSASESKASVDKRSKSENSKKPPKTTSMHPPPPYMQPHPYGHPDAPYYPPMPPGMPPHGGSMRVAVGVPPPPRGGKAGSPPRGSPHAPRPYPIGPGDPNYPPPPYPPPGHYSHHPGVPPPHMHPHYAHYPPPHHPPPRHMPMYGAQHPPTSKSKPSKKLPKPAKSGSKRSAPAQTPKLSSGKKAKKSSPSSAPKKKNRSPQITDKVERQKAAAAIQAVNVASGGKNDKAAALAAAILRGVTMRPSGKWQAQLYFAGKSRYIGVFDTREKAALAYEIAREKLKSEKQNAEGGSLSPKQTEAAVNAARKAAFEGVNERDPRLLSK